MIYNEKKENGYTISDFGCLENLFSRNVEFRNLVLKFGIFIDAELLY